MSEFRYPYIQYPNWEKYRTTNNGVFAVARPESDYYKYYKNYPFDQNQNPNKNNQNIYIDDDDYNNGIYYRGYNNPQSYYSQHPNEPLIIRSLNGEPEVVQPPPPLMFDHTSIAPELYDPNFVPPPLPPIPNIDTSTFNVEPPLLNPVVLVNRRYAPNNRARPPSFNDESEKITELKVKRDPQKRQTSALFEKHNFDDKPIKEFKILRDANNGKNNFNEKLNFDDIPVKTFNKDPVNFDETPIKPLKKEHLNLYENPTKSENKGKNNSIKPLKKENKPIKSNDNQPVNFDEMPIRPLHSNPFTADSSKLITPPQTVDSSIKSTPRTRERGAVYNFRKKNKPETKSKEPVVVPAEPVKPIKRFVTMRLGGKANNNNTSNKPIVENDNIKSRRPISMNENHFNQSDPNYNIYNSPTPSVQSNPAQTLINTKYVIIQQGNNNDQNKPSPRLSSRLSMDTINNISPTQSQIFKLQEKPKDIYNITRIVDPYKSPRGSINLTPINNTSTNKPLKEVNYEIIKRTSPRKTIVHHYFK